MSAVPLTARIHATAAERLVLAGVMREAELVLPRLAELRLTEEKFGGWAHRFVWRACVGLYDAGRDVGPYSVWLALAARGELAELGYRPAAWLADVYAEDPTGAWAVPAAHDVLRAAARRNAAYRALGVLRDAISGARETGFYEQVLVGA